MLGDECNVQGEREVQLTGWVDQQTAGEDGTLCAAGLKVTFCQAARLPDRGWGQTLRWTTAVPLCLPSASVVAVAVTAGSCRCRCRCRVQVLLLPVLLSWAQPRHCGSQVPYGNSFVCMYIHLDMPTYIEAGIYICSACKYLRLACRLSYLQHTR